ncbi:MAG: DNA polymerase III subunit chi [Silicimonas sp.]|nr:DNA polymerase III subunit chi [Silicimonas sp.]
MGAAYFYHLTERPLEATLPVLIGKALEAGWRVAVRGRDPATLERLDRQLWAGDGFLPHGMAGGDHDAEQPVLLTLGKAGNGASCLMSVDGAEVTVDEVKGGERVCILFDGANADAVEHARGQWKSLTDAGVSAQYWAEEGGRWAKKAEA